MDAAFTLSAGDGCSVDPQCLKWRTPVNTIAIPSRSAAAITSSSRVEPPGWATAVAPACAAASIPSGNGKNASLANTESVRSRPTRFAFATDCRIASTREVAPPPSASVRSVLPKTTALLLTCFATLQLKASARSSSSVGLRRVAVGHEAISSIARSGFLNQHTAKDAFPIQLTRVDPVRVEPQQPAILLLGQAFERFCAEIRSDEYLGEDLVHLLGEREVEGAVGDDDPAKRRLGIGLERPSVGFGRGRTLNRHRTACCA